MTPDDHILIVGAGSVGERHIRNLHILGYRNIVVLRQRNRPFRDIAGAQVTVVTSWDEVIAFKPLVAVICTPTSEHISNARACVALGIHVLIEKPLSHTTDGIAALKEVALKNKVLVQVAYMMRYYPLLMKVRALHLAGSLGNLVYMHTYWGEYLPDWHPWEDYRQSYAARKELGGGAAVTLSHDLDVCNWMMGESAHEWKRTLSCASALEIDVDAGADFLLSYAGGATAHVHVNFFERMKRRSYHFVFTDAVATIDYFNHVLTIGKGDNVEKTVLPDFDRNELYIAELKDFLNALDQPARTAGNIDEATKILEICTI